MKQHMSKSQYKNFMECPAKELAIQKGDWPEDPTTLPMLIGSYVDKRLTEGAENAYWWMQNLDKEERKLFLTSKDEKRADVKKADKLVERIKDDPVANNMFLGDETGQVKLECEIANVQWVCYLDVCKPENDFFVELKTVGRMKDEWVNYNGRNIKTPWYSKYWVDMAVYWEACRQNYEAPLCGYLVAGLLADSPAIRAVAFDETTYPRLEEYLNTVKQNTKRINKYKTGELDAPACMDINCDYCNATQGMDVEIAKAWWA